MIAWVTTIFGGIDEPKKIPEQTIPFTHYHFDESCRPVSLSHLNDRMKSLYFKSQHHKLIDADIYIYTDGKIQVLSNDFMEQALNKLGNNDLAILKHGSRPCIYEEVDYIEKEIKKGNEYLRTRYAHRPLRQEVENYRLCGYPENNGLNDCCIFIRRSSANELFNAWWQSILSGAFDQTAIQFVAWKMGIKIISLEFKPNTFRHVKHLLIK